MPWVYKPAFGISTISAISLKLSKIQKYFQFKQIYISVFQQITC